LTIESNRTLGGVAAILTLLGIFSLIASLFHYIFPNSTGISLVYLGVGGIFGALALVGFLLYLIAMYGFSKDYNEHRIFNYLLYGIVVTIVAAVIVVVIALLVILSSFASLFPNIGSSTSSSQMFSSFSKTFSEISPFFGLVGVIWIAFNVKAFNLLSDKSKVPLFRTGAKVLLAGALVNIVISIVFAVVGFYVSLSINSLFALLTIGNFVQNIAWVLLAMSYFRIQAPAVPMQSAAPVYVPPVSGQVKFCTYCGAPNPTDATYCARCRTKTIAYSRCIGLSGGNRNFRLVKNRIEKAMKQ
jgi:uncharacterized membrane protein